MRTEGCKKNQVKTLGTISSSEIKITEEKITSNLKIQAYTKLLALNDELHLNSNGRKWTREELYER